MKRFLAIITLSLMSVLCFSVTNGQAKTVRWHSGVPSFLVHKKYRTKYKYAKGMHVAPSYYWCWSHKNNFYLKPTQSGSPDSALKAKYRKVGKYYYITGKGVYWKIDHYYLTFKIRRVNQHKIVVSRRFGKQKYLKPMVMRSFTHFPRVGDGIWR